MQDIKEDRCRICLAPHNLKEMLTDEMLATAEKVVYCTAIQISSEELFPFKICTKCEFYLNVACVFKMVCEWSDFKLGQELKQIKDITHATHDASSVPQKNTKLSKIIQYSKLHLQQLRDQNHSVHLMDSLLMQDYPETFRYFSCKGNEVNLLEQSVKNTLLKQDNHFHKFLNEKTVNNNHSLNIIANNTDLTKETEYIMRNANPDNNQIIINERLDFVNKEIQPEHLSNCNYISVSENSGSVNDEHAPIDQSNILSSDVSVFEYERGKDTVTNLNKNKSLIVENKISVTECNCLIGDEPLSLEENGLAVDIPLLHSEESDSEYHIINKECNLVSRTHLTNDPADSWSIYGKVCLFTEDPLLPKVNTLENEEIDLKNLEVNEDGHDLKSFLFKNKIENPEKIMNAKHVSLSNISLCDFENFEKEQLNNLENHTLLDNNMIQKGYPKSDTQTNNKILAKQVSVQSESRVGRHIAKKNAGQPPKRYSPTPEAVKHPTLNCVTSILKQNVTKNDSSLAPKPVIIQEAEEKLDKKTELKNLDSIPDHEYVLESDLSMPEPIFEETIVTESFYLADDDGEAFLGSFNDEQSTDDFKKAVPEERKRRRDKRGTTKIKPKKKGNIVDQTAKKRIRPKRYVEINKRSTSNVGINNKNKHQSNISQSSSESDEEFNSNSDKFDSKLNKSNKNTKKSVGNSDIETQQKFHRSSIKRKHPTKKSRNKRKDSNTTCKLCNKTFSFPSHLQRHLTAHIGVRHFTCKYCNKEFLHRYNLSVHMRTHTGNFPLHCDICNRGFAWTSILERHKRTHTGETPFQCQYCLQRFSQVSSLNMHEKMHLNRPSFHCDICYKVFSYKSSLNAHKKGHSGFKPHSCSVCHKRFTRRTSVLRHMSCHLEVKRFKCRTCGEVLKSKKSLVKHQKMHLNT